MYTIEFYETADGKSELWDFLENLRIKAAHSKDARIQHKQINLYIQLLQDNGTRLNENITKHIEDDIWELRPGNNRVFYFFIKIIPLFYYISSVKKPRRHQNVKLKRQKQNALIISQEGSLIYHENME